MSRTAARWQDSPEAQLKFWEPEEGATENPWSGTKTNITRFRAYVETPYDREPVGHVDLEDPDEHGGHSISAIDIDRDWQGKGIGRELLMHTQSLGYNPRHSGEYTPEGEQFAYRTPEFGPVHPWMEDE